MTATLDVAAMLEPRRPCGYHIGPLEDPTAKQRAFLLLANEREVGFGGAGGPGKSWALLMAALQYVCVPGYAAALFRQTYPQLAGDAGLIQLSQEWLGASAAVWNATEHLWSFPGGGTLRFGHAERDPDRFKYSGHAFSFVGFDELTNWSTPRVYLYVGFARVRRPKANANLPACPGCGLTVADIPLRTRWAANPNPEGLAWVRQRFGIQLAGGCPDGRRFMPARLSDNKHLDRESYEAGLAELDPVERARMLNGDWQVTEAGRMFRAVWFTD